MLVLLPTFGYQVLEETKGLLLWFLKSTLLWRVYQKICWSPGLCWSQQKHWFSPRADKHVLPICYTHSSQHFDLFTLDDECELLERCIYV